MDLVTGGTGLLGSELIRQLLDAGHKVRATYNRTQPSFEHINLEWVKADLLDIVAIEQALENVSAVYHCAAIVSFSPKMRNALYMVNVEGTRNILDCSLASDVNKFVYVSSVAALGKPGPGAVINEQTEWDDGDESSVYGRSKYLAEREVWRAISEGLNGVIVNPSIILGAGEWGSGSTGIFQKAYESYPWYTTGVTGFVDVRDVARAMILLMRSDITGERFILNAANVSYKDVLTMAAEAFGSKAPRREVTPFMAKIIGALGSASAKLGMDPLITKETARSAVSNREFDNAKLLQALPGFQYHCIADTIQFTAKALQQKLNG